MVVKSGGPDSEQVSLARRQFEGEMAVSYGRLPGQAFVSTGGASRSVENRCSGPGVQDRPLDEHIRMLQRQGKNDWREQERQRTANC